MQRRTLTTARALALGLLAVSVAHPAWAAGTRQELNLQAQLADVNGVPLSGTYNITVEIYDALTDGNRLHQEAFANTPVERGVYNVKLGSNTPLPDAVVKLGEQGSLYMSVIVDLGTSVETLEPRQKLTSNLFAMNGALVDGRSLSSLKDATFRFQIFSSYSQWDGNWFTRNDPWLWGGQHPSNWTDSGYRPVHMDWGSPEKFRALFTRKAFAGKNAMVCADEWYSYSSTNGKICMVLFRIQNTTANAINWQPHFYYSSYGGWSEWAGVALNGSEIWHNGGNNCGTHCTTAPTMSIPANKTSTVVIMSSSSPQGGGTRALGLAFYNNSLQLPDGLRFVDDLHTATSVQ